MFGPKKNLFFSFRNSLCGAGLFLFFWFGVTGAGPAIDAANTAYSQGKLKECVPLYKKALSAGENPTLCYFNCANAYFQLDSLSKALAFYRQCLYNAPDFVKARLNLAIIYYMLGDLGRCIAASKQTLRLEPDNQKMLIVLAAAYEKAGSIPEAAVQYEYIVRKYPELTETYLALGQIYRNLNNYETAIQWLGEYPETGKNYPYALLLIADIYDQADDAARSLFYLQKSFDMDKSKETFIRIVETQKRMGNDLVALETAMEGLTQFPAYADLAIAAANIAFDRRLIEKAEYCYSKAYDLGSPAAVVGLENVRIIRAQKALQMQEARGE